MTGYTQYELLKSSDKNHQSAIKEYIDQNLVRVELSQVLMDFSARVYNLYSKHQSTKGSRITDGDIVNAALSIVKNAPVMTIDNNDYPRPFFIDQAREYVEYDSNKNRRTIDTVYILKPDMVTIKYCFEKNQV